MIFIFQYSFLLRPYKLMISILNTFPCQLDFVYITHSKEDLGIVKLSNGYQLAT